MYNNSNYYEAANVLRYVSGYVFVSKTKTLTILNDSWSENVWPVFQTDLNMQLSQKPALPFISHLTRVIIFLLNSFTINDNVLAVIAQIRS